MNRKWFLKPIRICVYAHFLFFLFFGTLGSKWVFGRSRGEKKRTQNMVRVHSHYSISNAPIKTSRRSHLTILVCVPFLLFDDNHMQIRNYPKKNSTQFRQFICVFSISQNRLCLKGASSFLWRTDLISCQTKQKTVFSNNSTSK